MPPPLGETLKQLHEITVRLARRIHQLHTVVYRIPQTLPAPRLPHIPPLPPSPLDSTELPLDLSPIRARARFRVTVLAAPQDGTGDRVATPLVEVAVEEDRVRIFPLIDLRDEQAITYVVSVLN